MFNFIKKIGKSVSRKLCAVAAVFGVLAASAVAHAEDTFNYAEELAKIPNGCNTSTWIQEAIKALGGPVSVAIGGFFIFLLIVMALRWARLGMGGSKR